MKVLVCEPGKRPYEKEIENTLSSLQEEVEGYIEVVYIYDDNVAIICNEEGKIKNLPVNRPLYDIKGKIIDILYGTILFVQTTTDGDFCSLTTENIAWYKTFAEHYLYQTENGQFLLVAGLIEEE